MLADRLTGIELSANGRSEITDLVDVIVRIEKASDEHVEV